MRRGSPTPGFLMSPSTSGDRYEIEHGPSEVVDLIGGGGWTRTSDLRIMSRPPVPDSKQLQQLSSAKCGKVEQNPQTIRKQKKGKHDV